jgi:hypothetical protein
MQPNSDDGSYAIFDGPQELKRATPRELVAAILFDSLAQPFADARGATDARQVVMRAEEFDIHLKISTNPPQHQIVGQVFARDDARFISSVRLQLFLNGRPIKTTWSDNFGQFQFDEVPDGSLRLQLDMPRLTVVGGITITHSAENEERPRPGLLTDSSPDERNDS